MIDESLSDRYHKQQTEQGAKVQQVLDAMAEKYSAILGHKVQSGRVNCLMNENGGQPIFYEKKRR